MQKLNSMFVATAFVFIELTVGNCLTLNSIVAQENEAQFNVLGFVEGSEKLVKQAYGTWQESYDKLMEGEKVIQTSPKLEKIAKNLGESYVLSQILLRQAGQLINMGEPAGLDLQKRGTEIVRLLTLFRDKKYRHVIKNLTPQADSIYKANIAAVRKKINGIRQLAARGNFEKAAQQYLKILDEVNGYGFFLSLMYQNDLYQALSQGSESVGVVNRALNEKYKKTLLEKFVSEFPDVDKATDQIQKIVKKFRETGEANVGGSKMKGPQLFRYCFKGFQSSYLQLVHCLGIAAASKDNDLEEKTQRSIAKIEKELSKTLISIIEADVRNVAKKDVEELYVDYLRIISPIVANQDHYKIVRKCIPVLDELSEKSDEFVRLIDNYQAATSELLYWKKRTAADQQDRISPRFSKLDDLLLGTVGANSEERKMGLGLITENEQAVPTKLETGLDIVYAKIPKRTVGNKVVLDRVVKSGDFGFSGIHHRYWVQFKLNEDFSSAIQNLRNDLLVSSDDPPLTLESAFSLSSAVKNSFENMGGRVTSTNFESAVWRLAKMPASAKMLVPIGRQQNGFGFDQLLVKMTVEPEWIRHTHFFLDLRKDDSDPSQVTNP